MPLVAGTKIGGYEVLAPIGAGGMGEVYRARDHRLGRDVAIKILSPAIAADAEGLARFEREARALASLNHPNIAAIYGVDDSAGFPALILELVDGETLADRIARGRLPVDEALRYARQIADALDTAHEAGIVHRDLKPGNVKITEAGTAKVLDFGLAKAIAAAASPDSAIDPANSPTVTVKGTKGGVILGTAAYMSPEQARGKAIDKRTDIWAFGCVLYEMLTGGRAFDGETTSDMIAAIIERQPDLSKLPAAVPPHVRRVIERCLEKDPKRRVRDIADVRAELETPDATPAAAPRSLRAAMIATIAVVAAVALSIVMVVAWRSTQSRPPQPLEFALVPPEDTMVLGSPAPSPDGRQLAFVARGADGVTAIWFRAIGTRKATPLPGTEGALGQIFWSPDSRAIGFVAGGRVKTIPAAGGPVVNVCPITAHLGATWGPDNIILLAPTNRTAIHRVPATGGTLEAVTTLDTTRENSHRWPHFLPDGRHFLFTVRSDSAENNAVYVGSIDGEAPRRLFATQSNAIYVEPGLVLHVRDGTLIAQPFDARALSLSGTARAVASPVLQNTPSAEAEFDASFDGSVLTYREGAEWTAQLTWFDRSGQIAGTFGPPGAVEAVNLSPDGRRAAVDMVDAAQGTRDVWIVESGGALRRFTTHSATDWVPVWSPDGGTLVFASDRQGQSSLFRAPADGSSPEKLLYRGPAGAFPNDWSPDGRQLLLHVDGPRGEAYARSFLLPLAGGDPIQLMDARFPVSSMKFSPDSERIAFHSPETGDVEIYVMALRDRRKIRVSTAGGFLPIWTKGGRELLYVNPQREIMSVAFGTDPFAPATPQRLFAPCRSTNPPSLFVAAPNVRAYDALADGSRVLAVCRSNASSAAIVTMNWMAKIQ
ncbi:MAG TPA: protein kinase [Vicinamibacterales bacterium]|nr:protein kinase [Vicinamibacterales bacterium]